MSLIPRLLSDLADAQNHGFTQQEFAASVGLSPAMLRALRKSRAQLGEVSLGCLLVATGDKYVNDVLAYLRSLGHRDHSKPRRRVPSSTRVA